MPRSTAPAAQATVSPLSVAEMPQIAARRPGILALQILLAGATLGIALQTDLLPKLLRSAGGWITPAWPLHIAETAPGDLDNVLTDAYHLLTLNQPLLPWLLWIGSAGALLWVAVRPSLSHPESVPTAARWRPAGLLAVAVALVAIVAVALAARAANLLPDASGIWPASNFDEQVYYTAARLLAQGDLPYRDFLLIHPPGMAYALAPGLATQAPWGGPAAFGAARQWLFAFSLLAVPLIFLVGRKLGGNLCGLVAAAVLALDGNAAGVAVLETLVNLWSLLALLLYLSIPHGQSRRRQVIWTVLCGMCCAAALISKVPALAIVVAMVLHALLLRRPAVAAGIAASTAVTTLVALAPFLVVAPGAFVREVIFFALLRPQEVSPGVDHAARIAAYPESYLTSTLAALGLLLLAAAIIRVAGRRGPASPSDPTARAVGSAALQRWLVIPLWAVPVLAVFIFSRSYHATHYVQWAPPLALLAGAAVASPVWHALLPNRPAWPRTLAWGGIPLGVLLLLPLAGSAWTATFTVPRDTVYLPSNPVITKLTGPNDSVLSFDPGYDFVAGRPPVRLADGERLVDSAADMTYYALGLDSRPFGDLLSAALHASKEMNALTVFQSATAQASILSGFWRAPLVVVDGKIGLPQLRGQTLGLLKAMAVSHEQVEHVTIYHVDPNAPAAYDFGTLRLQALTFEPLTADGSGTGVTLLRRQPTPTLVNVAPGQVLQIGAYWQPRPGLPDIRIHLRLATPAGQAIVDLDQAPEEDTAATHLWNPALLYPDLHNLAIPATLAPGSYRLLLGVSAPNRGSDLVTLPAALIVRSAP
jgi:hypothetical protein